MYPGDTDSDGGPTRFNPARRAAFDPDAGPTAGVDPDGGPTSRIDQDATPTTMLRYDEDPTAALLTTAGRLRPDEEEPAQQYRDWRWVEEWRAQGDKPAWAPGIALGIFVAILVAVALIVLTSGLRETIWLAIVVNLVIGAGMAPALWLSRGLPVLRFLAAGAAVGLIGGWIWMLATFPSMPAAT